LGPLSLRIERGSITFITGENGAGKSTLLKLITGLYPPRSGAALLNGTRVDLRAARDLFAFVAAEHVLFERLFGYRATDPHRVEALLADFGLADITHYRDGRFTRLALSSGQKKRVGLVVALLEDKPVLVLDEWTAEQDPPMRRRFYQDILPALCKAGKAVILVTHDDRNLDACDQLVTMRDGLIRSSVVSQLGRSQ
jgi:putative ATP-binding cassette transporter